MKCILLHRLGQTDGLSRSLPTRLPAGRAGALLLLLAAAVAAGAFAHAVGRALQDRRHLATGPARWIWWTDDLEQPLPLHFWAVRSFRLDSAPGARARIFADGAWNLWINGEKVGSGRQQPGDRLVTIDASGRLRVGENRVVLDVLSETGAGGILFALDVGTSEHAVVSDGTWRMSPSEAEARAGRGRAAILWGRPPMYPWGYP
jgi:hypothetical protein